MFYLIPEILLDKKHNFEYMYYICLSQMLWKYEKDINDYT